MSIPEQPRAIVTGAGSGLGRAFCIELARRQGRVLAVDINLAGAEETAALVVAAGGKAVARRCDVSRPEEVEGLAAEVESAYGAADLIVNNAGVAVSGPIGSVPLADWQWIMGVNLWGVIYGCHSFVPRFKTRGSGHIINVASTAGLVATPELGPYNVTKTAVVALSETLYSELHGTGVGVTVLCPTFFKTNIGRAARSSSVGVGPEDVEKLMERTTIQAPEVARFALAAADAGELYALPHADGRWAWRLKRFVPQAFQGTILPRAAAAMRRANKK